MFRSCVVLRCAATDRAQVAPSVKTNNKGGIEQALSGLPTDEALEKNPELLENFRRFSYPVLTQLRPVPLGQKTKEE